MTPKPPRPVWRYAGLLVPIATAGLQWLLRDAVEPYVWFLFYPATFASAWIGGLGIGIASTFMGAALVWYIYLPPAFTLLKWGPHLIVSEIVFIVTGVLLAFLVDRLDRETASARESERRFESTFEQAAVGIAMVAPDGRWLRVNRKFSDIVGYTHEELLARAFQDITHPDDLAADVDNVRRVLTGEIASYTMEKRYIRKDGSQVWVNRTVALARTADGKPDYFISVIEDIDARKAAEALASATGLALLENEERLRMFVEHAPAALAMFDHDMRYMVVSRRWVDDYTFRDPEEFIGRSHYEIFPEVPERWRVAHARGLAGEVVRAEEDRFRRKDGSDQWIRWELRPWHRGDRSVGGIVIFSEDITRQKLAEQEIRELNSELERRVELRTEELTASNRELDSFAYAVSHDLRAPLRALTGFSQALLEDHAGQLDLQGKTYLGHIQSAATKMGQLVDGLLALARTTRGSLKRVRVDLSTIATNILTEMERMHPERVVDWSVEPGMSALGDEHLVDALLRNLIDNAWKYTRKTDRAIVRVFTRVAGSELEFCVTDNGAGFDMAHAGRLFKPFQRLHRVDEFPGIGIGLANVERIVRRHGGRIHAEGVPHQGATISFTLPDPAAVPDEDAVREHRTGAQVAVDRSI